MTTDRYANSTNYVHPQESNLLNVHKAMVYRDGEPHLRVTLGSDNITITGDVNLVDNVRINNSTTNPVPVFLTNTSSTVYQGTIPWATTVTNWPALQTVNGTVYTVQSGTWSVGVTGNVTVTNFTSTVNVASLPAITGTVTVSNFTSTVHVDNIATSVTVSNFTSTVNINTMPSVTVSNFTSTVVVNNTLTISNTSFAITNFPTTSTVYQGTNPWHVTGSVTIDQSAGDPTIVKYINAPTNLQMDMTERLRVAQPAQSWWYAPTIDKDGDLRYIESYTGTNAGSVFVQNLSSINMSPGTDANGSFIRISRRRHKLRPGVSMLCAFSVNWNGFVPDGNVTKRVGMFTNYNGVFYEMTGDLHIVIRRRLTDGTLVEKRIEREDFNIDPLNTSTGSVYDLRPIVINSSTLTNYVSKTAVPITGDGTVYRVVFTVADPSQFYVSQKGRITGVSPTLYNGTVMVTAISGNNVTFVYNQDPGVFSSLSSAKFDHTNLHNQYVFGFDFNGSRATNIRFFIDGPLGRKAIHEESFGGTLSTPFANAPAISTRYEIFNSGSPSRLPNFTASSELVNVEAESELNPSFGSVGTTVASAFNKNTDVGNEYAICGIALRTGEPYQRADLQVQRIQIVDLGNLNPQNSGIFQWRLVLNPTVSAIPASTNIGKASRFFDYANGATITGGTTLTGGYSQGTFTGQVNEALNFLNMGSNIAYDDSDILVLAVKLLVGGTDNSSVMGMINYIESL